MEEYKVASNFRKLEIKEELILANLGYIRNYTSKLTNKIKINHLDFEDYEMEAIAGVIESIDKFDTKKKIPLIGYASFFIKKRICSLVDKHIRLLSYPTGYNTDLKKVKAMTINKASAEQIKKKLGMTQERLKDILDSENYKIININFKLENGGEVGDYIADDKQVFDCKSDLYCLLNQLVAKLPDKQRKIINQSYALDGETKNSDNAVIGRGLGICRERVRQLSLKAHVCLKNCLEHRRITKSTN